MMRRIKSEILPTIKEMIESFSYECIGPEIVKENDVHILRIYIDKQYGVNISDCEKVSRGITDYLDSVEDKLPSNYLLEVSSPGIERPLLSMEDFQKFTGREVEITLKRGRKVSGILLHSPYLDKVRISNNSNEEKEYLFSEIIRGKLIYKEETGQKKTFKKIPSKKKRK